MEKQIVFLSFEKRVSKQGDAYNAVLLGEITADKHGVIRLEQKTFFVPATDDYSKISFGTIVDVDFGEPKTFGGFPPLINIEAIEATPYLV